MWRRYLRRGIPYNSAARRSPGRPLDADKVFVRFLYLPPTQRRRSLAVFRASPLSRHQAPYPRHVCGTIPPHNPSGDYGVHFCLLAAVGEPHAIAALAAACRLLYNVEYKSPDSHLWHEISLTTFDDPAQRAESYTDVRTLCH